MMYKHRVKATFQKGSIYCSSAQTECKSTVQIMSGLYNCIWRTIVTLWSLIRQNPEPAPKTRSLKNAEAYLIYSIRAASWVQGFADKQ